MPTHKKTKPRRVRPSTCQGVYGFSYTWHTETRSLSILETLHEHARERAAQCMNEGYVEGELIYESAQGRTYNGWWKTIKTGG